MKKTAAGFTLLEVMVALIVTAMVLGMVYGIVTGVSAKKQELDQESEGFHQAQVLFGRMSREIHSVYFVGSNPETFLRGGLDDNQHSFLELTTTVTAPNLPMATGISRVRYEMRNDPDIAPPLLLLVRQERALLPGGEAGEIESRLSSGVYVFRLRFFNGDSWQDQWDTAKQGSLPQMIELYLKIEIAGKRMPFMTTVAVPQIAGAS